MRKLILALLLIAFCINTCSAGLNLGSGVSYLEFYEGSSDHNVDDMIYDYQNDRIIYLDETNDVIKAFYPSFPTATASTSLLIDNVTTARGISLTPEGNIVFGTTGGELYKVEDFSGILDFTDSEQKAEYFTEIGDTNSEVYSISVDANTNYYVSCTNGKVYRIASPYYAVAELSGIPTQWSSGRGCNLDIKSTGFNLGFMYSTGAAYVIQDYDISTYTTGTEYVNQYIGLGAMPISSVQLSSGNIIGMYTGNSGTTRTSYVNHVNTSDLTKTSIVSYSTTGSDYPYFNDVVVDADGLIYVALDKGGWHVYFTDNQVEMLPFSATEIYAGSGDTSTSGESSTNPLIDYDGDGEVDQDDMKDMAVNYGPVLLGMMAFLFFMVAMSGRD